MIKKYPLALMQQKIYIYSKMHPNDPSYNLNNLFRLNGIVDYKKLIQAVEEVYNSYEIFKVKITSESDLYQIYDSNRLWKLNVIDIENFNSNKEKIEYVNNDVSQKANEAMDLSKWPLIYVYLYKSKEVNFIYFKQHHIVMDVYSAFQIFDEISRIYNCETFKREKKVIYFDLLNVPVDKKRNDRAIRYFKNEIGKLDTLSIKGIDEQRDNNGALKGRNDDFEISNKVVDKICKKMNISEFQILLSVYALIIRSITRNDEFVIGIPVANRRKEFKNVPGLYINNLPLKFDFSSIKNFYDLINVTKKKMINILRYQQFDITNNMKLLSDDENTPSDFMNNFVTFYKHELTLNFNDIVVQPYIIDERYVNFPLSIVIEKLTDSYILHVRHTSQFNSIQFGNIFENIISQIDLDNEINLNDINLLNKEEQFDLLNKLNGHSVGELRINSTIIDIFDKISDKYSENIAVKYKDKTITYKRLNEISNNVARSMLNIGLTPSFWTRAN